MIGYGVVILARGLDRDPGEAFVLSAMNPLVLITLIGGAHNDAIMAAFEENARDLSRVGGN